MAINKIKGTIAFFLIHKQTIEMQSFVEFVIDNAFCSGISFLVTFQDVKNLFGCFECTRRFNIQSDSNLAKCYAQHDGVIAFDITVMIFNKSSLQLIIVHSAMAFIFETMPCFYSKTFVILGLEPYEIPLMDWLES